MWRLITEKVATLFEVETHYSIDDLADANDALNALAEAHREAERRAHR